jgi:non-canonical (house-cleaning) NTP pyrophosphatase
MRVAIGSAEPVQIEAVREAWGVFGQHLRGAGSDDAQFLGYSLPVDAPRLPLSVDDLIKTVRDRVEDLILQLKRERVESDYYIGLQAGFNVVDSLGPRRMAFLESWAFVSDGHKGYYGHGGGISVPTSISDPVIDRGIGLGIVTDRFSSQKELANGQGLWGLLTSDVLSTRHSFVIALLSAFAPFYNPAGYR